MALEQEQRAALHLIESIEGGTLSSTELFGLVEDADPALLYLIVTWLRKHYIDHVNADTIGARLVELSSRPAVAAKMKEGQQDAVVEWFEENYSYRKLDAQKFVELIIEKLEG